MQIVFAGILTLTDYTDVCGTFIGVASKSAFGGKADIAGRAASCPLMTQSGHANECSVLILLCRDDAPFAHFPKRLPQNLDRGGQE